jgi:hypothetical protein
MIPISELVKPWKLGPLAISELDDTYATYDFTKIKSIKAYFNHYNILKLERALKVLIFLVFIYISPFLSDSNT